MRRLEQPDSKPQRPPYVRVQVDGGVEPYVFRLASPGAAQRLAGVFSAARESGDLEEMEAACGAILGACWADERWALDSEARDGRGVYDELWDHGWAFQTILALAAALMERMAAAHISESEVADRVRFFGDSPTSSAHSTSG